MKHRAVRLRKVTVGQKEGIRGHLGMLRVMWGEGTMLDLYVQSLDQ